MSSVQRLEHYLETKKQKVFEYDFLKDMEKYEVWDEIQIGREFECKTTYAIEEEDLINYARSVSDPNLIFNDPDTARKAGFPGLVAHPVFVVALGFWCIGLGPGSWVRSPGAMNPGQRFKYYEPFFAGETISIKVKAYDKWVSRNRYYVTYQLDCYNQKGTLKCNWWCTLIVPPNRQALLSYRKYE